MALLIWIQSLMELAFGLLFWLFGLRSFGLAWRVVQEMCRKPLFEDSQRRLRIVFVDLIFSSFAVSASIFRVGNIVFRENGVIWVQRAQQCDQVYSIRSMVLVHTEGPPFPSFVKLFLHKLDQDFFLRRSRAIHDFCIFVQKAELIAQENVLKVAQGHNGAGLGRERDLVPDSCLISCVLILEELRWLGRRIRIWIEILRMHFD